MIEEQTAVPAARIVGGPPRTESVELTWPVECDGRTFSAIVVHRLTAAEVAHFVEHLEEDGVRLPMFRTEDGALVPSAVLDAMDHDDSATLNEVAQRLLPFALRGDRTSDSLSATAEPSSPSSPAS